MTQLRYDWWLLSTVSERVSKRVGRENTWWDSERMMWSHLDSGTGAGRLYTEGWSGQSSGQSFSPLTSGRILATLPHTHLLPSNTNQRNNFHFSSVNYKIIFWSQSVRSPSYPSLGSPLSTPLISLIRPRFMSEGSFTLREHFIDERSRPSQLTVQFNCYDNVLQVLKAFYWL